MSPFLSATHPSTQQPPPREAAGEAADRDASSNPGQPDRPPTWRPLRVAVLAEQFPRLSETFVLEQAAGLARRGHDVSVLSFHRPREEDLHAAAGEHDLDRRVRCFDMPRGAAGRIAAAPLRAAALTGRGISPRQCLDAQRFGAEVRSLRLLYAAAALASDPPEPFDVIHCHFGNLGAVGVALRELGLLRGPIITSFHGRDVTRYPSRRPGVYDELFRLGDRFLVNSGFTAGKVVAMGCDPAKIDKVPVAFDTHQIPFRPRTLEPGEAVRLVCVGRLVEKKGHEFAIRGIAELGDASPRVELEIIGGGPLRGRLRRLIRMLGVGDRVTLRGPQPPERVREAYDRGHLFLVPSVTDRHGDHEGQGLVLQEAQASGLPVIATRHNGFPEGMIDGETGFLVPERDPAAIADRLRWLIQNHDRWPAMGEAGSRFVRSTYDRRFQNGRLERVFLRLAGSSTESSPHHRTPRTHSPPHSNPHPMHARLPITATIITRDEAGTIARCVQGVSGWVDEVIVVDSESTDDTVRIARQAGAQVVVQPWLGFSKQKNLAASLARNAWVLSLDADELIGEELARSIAARFANTATPPDPRDGFALVRRSDFLGVLLNNIDRKAQRVRSVRLYHRDHSRWDESMAIHERVVVPGERHMLQGPLIQWRGFSLDQVVRRFNGNATVEARVLQEKGRRVTAVGAAARGVLRFFWCYLARGGWRMGGQGFLQAVLKGWADFLRYAKLWELQRGGPKPEPPPGVYGRYTISDVRESPPLDRPREAAASASSPEAEAAVVSTGSGMS